MRKNKDGYSIYPRIKKKALKSMIQSKNKQ